MHDLASSLGASATTEVEAVRSQLFGGQLADPGWPTVALTLAAELEYRSELARPHLERAYGVLEPTVRDTILQVPIGDSGLAGKVLQYTLHAAAASGHPV
jgi:hypothetical protein